MSIDIRQHVDQAYMHGLKVGDSTAKIGIEQRLEKAFFAGLCFGLLLGGATAALVTFAVMRSPL